MTHSPHIIDISWPLVPGMAIYPGNPDFKTEPVQDIRNGDSANVSRIVMGSHTGTHIDAPSHFIPGGATLDQIPLERMNGRAKVLDATGHGDIGVDLLSGAGLERGDIVLFRTDNSLAWACDSIPDDYVTLTYEAADYIAGAGVKLVGIDYLTIERPKSKRIPGKSVHKTLLGSGILICEGLRLKDVSPGEYEFRCLPLNIIGLDGCPARCVLEEVYK